jgi:hypothetical protein
VNNQGTLFYEDVFDVARAMVQAAGGTKAVAAKLWPNTPIAEAQRELLDCLNRERPRKICIEEFLAVMRMAREAGFHQGKHWIDQDTGYQPTPPTDPVVERDRLAESLDNAAKHFMALTNAAKALLDRDKPKSVK